MPALLDGSWWLEKKQIWMDFLFNAPTYMSMHALSPLPSHKKKLSSLMKKRRQIIIKTLWARRGRQTVLRRLMCGWVTATSGAGSTQSISRCDTGAIPTISVNIWAWSSCLLSRQLLLSPLWWHPVWTAMAGRALWWAWQCGVTLNCHVLIRLSEYLPFEWPC